MENKRIYLCLAHMSEDGMEQKYKFELEYDTNKLLITVDAG